MLIKLDSGAMDGGTFDISKCRKRFDEIRAIDDERSRLFTELLNKYQELEKEYTQQRIDYEYERDGRRELQQEVKRVKNIIDAAPFCVVIVDGDGALFRDDFLNEGAEGGSQAAFALKSEIKKQLSQTYQNTNTDSWDIIVQVVLNQDGLVRAISNASHKGFQAQTFLLFAREFRRTESYFDIVDVGSGKERADHRITNLLRLYVRIPQCRHVFFAGCHDNGYSNALAQYKPDPAVASCITLIETTPAEPSFLNLGFKRVSFPSVFRNEPLQSVSAPSPPTIAIPPFMPKATATSFAPSPPRVFARPASGSSNHTATTSGNGNGNGSAGPKSWATVGGSGSKIIDISPSGGNKKTKTAIDPRGPYYLVNRESKRLDEPLPRTDSALEARFQDTIERYGKLCNRYYLRDGCPNGASCGYSHKPELTPGELLVLKHKGRSLSCQHSVWCVDPLCSGGHVCLYSSGCSKGDGCRWADSHGMNTQPYKKIYSDGSQEFA